MGVPCNSSEDMGWPATKEALLHQPCNGFTPVHAKDAKDMSRLQQTSSLAPHSEFMFFWHYIGWEIISKGKKKLFERVEGHGKHQHHAGDAQLCYNIDLFPLLT